MFSGRVTVEKRLNRNDAAIPDPKKLPIRQECPKRNVYSERCTETKHVHCPLRDTPLFFLEDCYMGSATTKSVEPLVLERSSVQESLRHARNRDTVSREIEGETIVVPICRGVGDMDSVFTFNALGSELWKLLEKSRTEEEMASWVAGHFEVSPERALADVQNFLNDLRSAGLISSH